MTRLHVIIKDNNKRVMIVIIIIITVINVKITFFTSASAISSINFLFSVILGVDRGKPFKVAANKPSCNTAILKTIIILLFFFVFFAI